MIQGDPKRSEPSKSLIKDAKIIEITHKLQQGWSNLWSSFAQNNKYVLQKIWILQAFL